MCGRARGYQQGSPDAFDPFTYGRNTIDSTYFNGLYITHGSPRQHIWSYAVGVTDNRTYDCCNCPSVATPGPAPPSFIGSNYYCESGTGSSYSVDAYYLSDPLWDGAGCSANNTCCSNTDQPWFHHQLSGITQDDIEVRICRERSSSNEDI